MQLFSDNFSYLYKFDCNLYDPKIFVSYCLHFMHVFFFLSFFFQFQFSLKLQYYIFRRKIDWLKVCYIIGTRFTDGRSYIYVHDEFSNLVQVKHTSLEKVQQLLSINKVSKIRCSAFGKGFAILYFRLSDHDKICICEKNNAWSFYRPKFSQCNLGYFLICTMGKLQIIFLVH